MKPAACDHNDPIRVSAARWVYGTPGIIPARYRCPDCGVWWDDPTERPETPAIYQDKEDHPPFWAPWVQFPKEPLP